MFSVTTDALIGITLVWPAGRSEALRDAMVAQYGDPSEVGGTTEMMTAVWFGKEYDIVMDGFGTVSYHAPNIIKPAPRWRSAEQK